MKATNAFSGVIALRPASATEMSCAEARETIQVTVSTIKQIAQKIAAIDDLASQEGMPALESAMDVSTGKRYRAGMPVTDHVRQLADRSQLIAQEISTIAVFSAELAERAGELLDELVSNIGQASDLLQVATVINKRRS